MTRSVIESVYGNVMSTLWAQEPEKEVYVP